MPVLAAGALPLQESPDSARRVVAVFDFEEKDPDDPQRFNPDPVPRYWFRAQDEGGAEGGGGRARPGFPAWNAAEFDLDVAASGRASVRLDAAGGSASLRLLPGAIPVFPGADYAVMAMVRTEGTARSRAFLTARLLDAARRPIAGSETRSAPMSTGGGWTPVAIDVRGEHAAAAFLQIDLELLQPRHFQSGEGTGASQRLGRHAVTLDDVSARAWFDDVAVYLVPRVTLECDAPANVAVAPQRPSLRFAVRDMVGEALDAVLTVSDIDGEAVSRHTVRVDPGGRIVSWTPPLPGYGWYTVRLEVTHAGTPVTSAQTQLAWLPPRPLRRPLDALGDRERRRFGLAADAAPAGAPAWPAFAPHIARAAGTGFMYLAHGDPAADPQGVAAALGFSKTPLDELLELEQEITLSFAAVPEELAAALKIDPRDTLALGRHGEPVWMPFLLPILDQYGQRVLRWQISPSSAAAYTAGHPDLATSLAGFSAGLAKLVPGPVLSVPWRADVPPPAGAGVAGEGVLGGVTLVYPHDAPAAGIGAAVAAWRGDEDEAGPGPEVTLLLETPPGVGAARADLDELVKRSVEFIAAVGQEPAGSPPLRAAIMSPWRWMGGSRPVAAPEPQLAVWRTVVDHLAGRRVLTELPVAPGVRCVVLGDAEPAGAAPGTAADLRPQRGVLIAWNESADEDDAVLRAYLGENELTRIDLFGNAEPIPRNTDAAGTHTIPIPRSPIIIDGIDPRMVRFLASFRIDPPFAPAFLTEHEHFLVLENPWPIRISGQLQIVSPDPDASGWTVSPRGIVPFAIAPGATERIPIAFSFRASEEIGRKTFSILVRLTADRTYPAQLMSAPLDVGSETLEFAAEAALSGDGEEPDVVVTASLTNKGRASRSFRMEAVAPGRPSQQLQISDLPPGEQVIRRFVFKGAARELAGRRIRASVADTDAPERLNTTVTAP